MKTLTLHRIAIGLLVAALALISIVYAQQEQQMRYAHRWIQGLGISRDEAQAKVVDADRRAALAEDRAGKAEERAQRAEGRLWNVEHGSR